MMPTYTPQFIDTYSTLKAMRKAAQRHALEQVALGNSDLNLSVSNVPAVSFRDWYTAKKAARLQAERVAKRGARPPSKG